MIEYSCSYVKTSGSLWEYCRDERHDNITDFDSLKFKSIFINNAGNPGTTNVEITVPMKYSSNFWRNLGMLLIDCKVMSYVNLVRKSCHH